MPIFDQGYQHWSGELSGHTWRWYAIARQGVRVGMKNWFLRIFIIFAWLPAIGLAFMLCVWGLLEQESPLGKAAASFFEFLPYQVRENPKAYRQEFWTVAYEFFMLCELRYSMLVVMIIGPSLISLDLRFNALPLYFSRPLRRIDYFLGKLGVVVWFLALVMIFPALIAYVMGLLFSLDLSIIPATLPVLLTSIVYGMLASLVSGLVILALSSLTRNSRYIALAWLAVILIGSITGLILQLANRDQRRAEQMQMAHREDQQRRQGPRDPANSFKENQERMQRVRAAADAKELESFREDWSPMPSYMAHLTRVGEGVMGSHAAWQRLADAQPPEERAKYFLKYADPQHPWYWSAGVLAVLVGISVCVLSLRVKSLDRLK